MANFAKKSYFFAIAVDGLDQGSLGAPRTTLSHREGWLERVGSRDQNVGSLMEKSSQGWMAVSEAGASSASVLKAVRSS